MEARTLGSFTKQTGRGSKGSAEGGPAEMQQCFQTYNLMTTSTKVMMIVAAGEVKVLCVATVESNGLGA